MNKGMRSGAATAALVTLFAVGACSSGDSGSGDQKGSASGSGSSNSATPGDGSPGGSALKTGESVDIGGSGDILVHVPVRDDAQKNAGGKGYDFDPMFTNVKQRLSALDLAICHMETPLSTTDTNLSIPATMSFNVPHEVAGTLKRTGFDGCDRVGNHLLDRGMKGIAETKKSLDDAGLENQGPTPTASTKQDPVTYDVKGLKVAQLAYTYTSANNAGPNTGLPPDGPWIKYWQWPIVKAAGILADAKRAKAQGADLVVVNMHWGDEYHSEANTDQRQIAQQLLGSNDVDFIMGTHVHVAQSCEKINGKYVVYGMGNFLSNQGPASNSGLKPAAQDGMIVDLKLTKGQDGALTQHLTYQPTHVNLKGHVIEMATKTQNPDAYKRVVWAMSQLGTKCDATPEG